MIWFTSDTHFGHGNIIRYCGRSYANAKAMDDDLIERLNRMVMSGDILYHLGDFAFGRAFADIELYRRRINCFRIILVMGSHDKVIKWMLEDNLSRALDSFCEIYPYGWSGQIWNRAFTLGHCAHRVWEKSHYGAINLYGHSHGNLPPLEGTRQMDVGVDPNGMNPISITDVCKRMDQIVIKPSDPLERHKVKLLRSGSKIVSDRDKNA